MSRTEDALLMEGVDPEEKDQPILSSKSYFSLSKRLQEKPFFELRNCIFKLKGLLLQSLR